MFPLLSAAGRLLVPSAHAQASLDQAFSLYCNLINSNACNANSTSLAGLFWRIGDFFAGFVTVAAVLAIIYAGVRLSMSGGNDQGKEQAKTIITTAIVGLVLALAAEAIIAYVGTFIGTI